MNFEMPRIKAKRVKVLKVDATKSNCKVHEPCPLDNSLLPKFQWLPKLNLKKKAPRKKTNEIKRTKNLILCLMISFISID